MKKIRKINLSQLAQYFTPLSKEEISIIIGGGYQCEYGMHGIIIKDESGNFCGFFSYYLLKSQGTGVMGSLSACLGSNWEANIPFDFPEGSDVSSTSLSGNIYQNIPEKALQFLEENHVDVRPVDKDNQEDHDLNTHYNQDENVIYYSEGTSSKSMVHEIVHAYQSCMNMQTESTVNASVRAAREFQSYVIQNLLIIKEAPSLEDAYVPESFNWLKQIYNKEIEKISLSGLEGSLRTQIPNFLTNPHYYGGELANENETIDYNYHWNDVFDLVGIKYY